MENKIKEIEYSILQETEINEIVDFYNSIHHSSRDIYKFKWEFLNSCFDKAIYIIARDKITNKIIGSQSAIPIELITSDGQKVLSAKSEDTIVSPEYRGLQIFDKMYEMLISECKKHKIDYIWGFTSAIKPFKKLGFEIPFLHSQSLIVFNIWKSYKYLSTLDPKNNFLKNLKIFGLVILSKIKILITNLSKLGTKKFECNISTSIDEISEIDLAKISKYKGTWFSISRSKLFLKWRISENPYANKSVYITVESKNILVALFAFSSNVPGIWYVIDEFYDPNLSLAQKSTTLNKALASLKNHKDITLDLIRTWDFTHNQISKNNLSIKKSAGFTHLNKGIPFVWLNLNENIGLDVKNIILSRIASQGMS